MIDRIKQWAKRRALNWFRPPNSPPAFYGPYAPGAVHTPERAMTLSPFYCGVRLYQTTLGSLPLVTYRKTDTGRERADDVGPFYLLHARPNPAMSRAVFWELCAKSMFLDGEFFCHVRKNDNGDLIGLYPIHQSRVMRVAVDENWNKAYLVREESGQAVYLDHEMIHLFNFSFDGIRDVRLLEFAAESLGLHRQVLESATACYGNAVRPSGYLKYPGKLNTAAIKEIKDFFASEYAGTNNTGKVPVVGENGEFIPFPTTNADDARIIEALGASVDDIARWLGISPLLLYNLARGTFSNLGAENTAFYQRTIRPLLDKIELELNHKIFGEGSEFYCEFLTEAILRGDPLQQAQVWHLGITDGYYLRSEPREWMNLPPVEGLDVPLYPQNMAPTPAPGTALNDPIATPAIVA